MKNLSERLSFSTQNPQGVEDYHVFKINKSSLKDQVEIYGILCFLCGKLDINLHFIESEDFKGCFDNFCSFYKNLEQKMEINSLDFVVCFFWIDEE